MADTINIADKLSEAREVNGKRQEILTRVKEVLIRRLNLEITPEKIDDDSPLFGMGLGLDSIDSLELVVGVEEEFGVSVPSDNLEVFLSVNTLVDFILGSTERFSATVVSASGESLSKRPWLKAYKALREGCLMYDAAPVILEMPEQDGGLEFITWLVSGNDIILEPNRAMHAQLLDENGRIVDLINILMFDEKFWFIPSPGNEKSVSWILSKAAEKSMAISDVSASWRQVVCEGPYSWKLVKPLAGFEVTGLSYLHFMFAEWEGNQVLIYRAGKTNEYGLRMFVSAGTEGELAAFLSGGAGDLTFLYEKDSAMLDECLSTASREVRFPSLNVTIMPGSSPVPNEIRWMVDTRKDDFIGRDAVLADFSGAKTRIMTVVADSGADLDEENFLGADVTVGSEKIGTIVISRYSPGLDRWFGYAEFAKDFGYAGNRCYSVRGKDGTVVPVVSASTPLFLTKSAQVQME